MGESEMIQSVNSLPVARPWVILPLVRKGSNGFLSQQQLSPQTLFSAVPHSPTPVNWIYDSDLFLQYITFILPPRLCVETSFVQADTTVFYPVFLHILSHLSGSNSICHLLTHTFNLSKSFHSLSDFLFFHCLLLKYNSTVYQKFKCLSISLVKLIKVHIKTTKE